MHITAYCPSCHSRYQLDPSLRGQRMRCPNPVCREVFEVQETPEESPSATPGEVAEAHPSSEPNTGTRPQQHHEGPSTGTVRSSGSVGDLVPILDAEVVHEVPPPEASRHSSAAAEVHEAVPEDLKPIPVDDSVLPPPLHVENLIPLEPGEEAQAKPIREVPSWHEPPPVRNPHAAPMESPPPVRNPHAAPMESPPPASPPPKVKKTLPAVPAKPPEETQPLWHSPPPVRRRGNEPLPEPEPSGGPPRDISSSPAFSAEPTYETGMPPSRASRRALWVIGAMVVVAGFMIASVTIMALNAYVRTESDLVAQARREYEEGKYGTAAKTYQHLVYDFPTSEHQKSYQLLADLSQLRDRVYAAQTDPGQSLTAMNGFLEGHKGEQLLNTYKNDIAQTLAKLAGQLTVLAQQQHDPTLLNRARETLAQSERYNSERVDNTAILDKMARAEAEIAGWRKKQELLELFSKWQRERPSVKTVTEARHRARQGGFDQDAEVKQRIAEMETAARQSVRYVAGEIGTAKAVPEAVEPSLLIVTPMFRTASPPAEGKRAILALARGVLYALDQNTGQELWATRVGIDTATLPVRLPPRPASPELLLVLSADRNTIMALEPLTGTLAWQRRLSAPCLGRPLVIGRRAFVPTYDGRVYDIETVQGHVLGHFELGDQHLTVGGAYQQGTDLLYFPGDSDYLYVLDAALGNQPTSTQTKGCVAILHTGHPSGSLRSEPILVSRQDPFAGGTNSVASYLILAQSDGLDHMKLRVFELPIESPNAPPILQTEPPISGWSWFQPYYDSEKVAFVTDAGIFGLYGINQVRNEDKPLFPMLREGQSEETVPAESRLMRGQVVRVADSDFWLLANGKLQRRHLDLFRGRTVPVWSTALPLGSPIHGSQVDDSGKTLFVVTQDLTRQIYLATAVSAEDGTIKWQRQLGLECQGDPLVLGQEVISVDRGGGLCVFDGSKYRHQERREWRHADPVYAPALTGGPITAYLLPGPDGTSVYEVSCPASGGRLTIRRYRSAQPGERPESPKEIPVDLKTSLAGTPAIVGQNLIAPLADGFIWRFPLPPANGPSEGGPSWRAERADVDARCHIVALGADEFLATDGSRSLVHWRWPQGAQTFRMVPEDEPSPMLAARIVAAPLVIPSTDMDIPWRVCVADADGNLNLLQGPALRLERVWPTHGKITAGPFRRGTYIGCIVDRNRLVWLDPAKTDPRWEYRTRGQGIVGQPQLVGDLLIVADLSGRFIALEPATGKICGPGYGLKASASPAATPVAFGPEAAFVPLTDGTVFLLALHRLRDPLAPLFPLGP